MTDQKTYHGEQHGPSRGAGPVLDRPNVERHEAPVGPFKLDRPEVHRASASRAHIGPPTKSGDHFTKTAASEHRAEVDRLQKGKPQTVGFNEDRGGGDGVPVPDRGRRNQQPQVTSGPSHFQRVAKGSRTTLSSISNPKSSDGSSIVLTIFGVIGLIVGMAILRGKTTINKGAALIAWLLLFFVCTVLAKLNKAVGVGLAVLLLIQAILEFGPDAFGGFLGAPGATTNAATTTPIQTKGNLAEDATVAILGYMGLKTGTDFLGGVASGAGKVAGGAAAGAAGAAGSSIWGKIKSVLGKGAEDVGGAAEDVAPIAGEVAGGAAEVVTGGAE